MRMFWFGSCTKGIRPWTGARPGGIWQARLTSARLRGIEGPEAAVAVAVALSVAVAPAVTAARVDARSACARKERVVSCAQIQKGMLV